MITPTIEIPASEIRRFQDLADEMVANTRKDLSQVVEQAAIYFCQSAGKASPASKKRRQAVRNPHRIKRRGKLIGQPWRFRVYTQGGAGAHWQYSDNRMDPRRIIGARYALRNTWRGMISKISSKKGPNLLGSGRRKYLSAISGEMRKTIDSPRATMTNRISYLLTVTPNIGEIAMRKANNRIDGWMDKQREKWKETWRT